MINWDGRNLFESFQGEQKIVTAECGKDSLEGQRMEGFGELGPTSQGRSSKSKIYRLPRPLISGHSDNSPTDGKIKSILRKRLLFLQFESIRKENIIERRT